MEKLAEKSGSLSRTSCEAFSDARTVVQNQDDNGQHSHERESNKQEKLPDQTPTSLSQAIKAVDRFLELSDKPLDNLHYVGSFPEIFDSKISKLEMMGCTQRFGYHEEEDDLFFSALDRTSKLLNKLSRLPLDAATTLTCLNRVSSVQHYTVSFLEEEFRCQLYSSKRNNSNGSKGTPKAHRQNSSDSSHHEPDRLNMTHTNSIPEEEIFPSFSSESISTMRRIARAMISAGYEAECCMIYELSRRHAFNDELNKQGFNNINVEDVQKMPWESLEETIATWIFTFRHCSTVLLPSERKLCEAIFASHSSIASRVFSDLTSAVMIRFLNFSGAVILTERAQEKLFKFLDMYETLRDTTQNFEEGEISDNLISEISLAQSRLGDAAVSIFCELENSIKCDNSRTPVPGGAVHPLTRYTMNYLKLACEYRETLEQVFRIHRERQPETDSSQPLPDPKQTDTNDDGTPRSSPFGDKLKAAMELLDANLDMKSRLYRDPALRSVFLMNNGRYIHQKIKGSQEIHEILGASWTRKRSSQLRQYHRSYQRETWSRVLQCMSPEGLIINGKVSKPVLKERFKCFNMIFEEIHKTQSAWVVSDEQMQSELRVSISAVVIPAYRSFLGRFKQNFDPGRQTEKYVKYQPEDVEALIDDLFDGNRSSLARRRT